MATRDTIEEKRLNEGELEIVQRHLDGHSIRESARIIGVSHGTVWQTLKRPHVAAYIERLRADAEDALRRRMLAAGPTAFDVLVEVAREGDSSAARVQAAKAILDRVAPARAVIEGGERPLTLEIAGARQALQSAARLVDDGDLGLDGDG